MVVVFGCWYAISFAGLCPQCTSRPFIEDGWRSRSGSWVYWTDGFVLSDYLGHGAGGLQVFVFNFLNSWLVMAWIFAFLRNILWCLRLGSDTSVGSLDLMLEAKLFVLHIHCVMNLQTSLKCLFLGSARKFRQCFEMVERLYSISTPAVAKECCAKTATNGWSRRAAAGEYFLERVWLGGREGGCLLFNGYPRWWEGIWMPITSSEVA